MVVQTKGPGGQEQDPLEREADQLADQLVGDSTVQDQPKGQSHFFSKTVQKKGKNSGAGVPVSDTLQQHIKEREGKGEKLNPAISDDFGSQLGADLSPVRIHTDARASQMSQSLHARAFTHGNDVFFDQGEYDPASDEGKKLLAHELVHTVQQAGGGAVIQRKPKNEVEGKIIRLELLMSAAEKKKALLKITYEKGSIEFKVGLQQSFGKTPGIIPTVMFADGFAPDFNKGGWINFYIGNPGVDEQMFPMSSENKEHAAKLLELQTTLIDSGTPIDLRIAIPGEQTDGGEPAKGEQKKGDHKPVLTMQLPDWFAALKKKIDHRLDTGRKQNPDDPRLPSRLFYYGSDGVQKQKGKDAWTIEIEKGALNEAQTFLTIQKASWDGASDKEKFADETWKQILEKVDKLKQSGKSKPDTYESGLKDSGQKQYVLPPVPAEIKGLDQQALKGTGEYTFRFLWNMIGGSLLHQTTEAMASKSYRWEMWDVTEAYQAQHGKKKDEDIAKDLSKKDEGSEVVGKMDHVSGDFSRSVDELKESSKQNQKNWDEALDKGNYMDLIANELNQQLYGLEVVTKLGKEVLGATIDFALDDKSRSIYWTKPGVYIIRAVGVIKDNEGNTKYAPSVATKMVHVKEPVQLSQEALDKPRKELADLQLKLALMQNLPQQNPEQIKQIEEQIKSLEQYVGGDFVSLLDKRIEDLRKKKKEVEKEYEYMLQHGIGLGRIREIDRQIENLQKQKKLLLERQNDKELKQKKTSLHSAEAVLVSEVTGQQYPLMIQIAEPVYNLGGYFCRLSDITTHKGEIQETETAQSKEEALMTVVNDFSSQLAAEYGGGILSIRLPNTGWFSTRSERVIQLKTRTQNWTKARERLTELAEAIAIAGLFVSNPGLAVAGVALTAGLAAERVIRRISNGTFELDGEAFTDLLDILSAAAVLVGKGLKGIQRIGRMGYYQKGNRFFLMTEEQVIKLEKMTSMTDSALSAASEIYGDLEIINNIIETQSLLSKGEISPKDAGIRMAKALKGAAMSIGGKVNHLKGAGQKEQAPEDTPLSVQEKNTGNFTKEGFGRRKLPLKKQRKPFCGRSGTGF
ncbi:MAG: DUF4157 domain-containing protein [Bacteroidia bacterium]